MKNFANVQRRDCAPKLPTFENLESVPEAGRYNFPRSAGPGELARYTT